MLIATTPFVAGLSGRQRRRARSSALVVRSRGLARQHRGRACAHSAGAESHEYTELLEDTRRQAIDRLVHNATLAGGNAVLSMRFDSSEIASTMSEIVAYGTAVVVEADATVTVPTTPVE